MIEIYDGLKFEHVYRKSDHKNIYYNFGFKYPTNIRYESCENTFPDLVANCQPNPPALDQKYLGQLYQSGFEHETKTLGLPECQTGIKNRLLTSGIYAKAHRPKESWIDSLNSNKIGGFAFFCWLFLLLSTFCMSVGNQ